MERTPDFGSNWGVGGNSVTGRPAATGAREGGLNLHTVFWYYSGRPVAVGLGGR